MITRPHSSANRALRFGRRGRGFKSFWGYMRYFNFSLKFDKYLDLYYYVLMPEVAPLEQLSQWLEQNNISTSNAALATDMIAEFVTHDLAEIFGEDGKFSLSVMERSHGDWARICIDPVFPWKADSGSPENIQKKHTLEDAILHKLIIPLKSILPPDDVRVHSWNIYAESEESMQADLEGLLHIPPLVIDQEDPLDLSEVTKEAESRERSIGLISPRMLRTISFAS